MTPNPVNPACRETLERLRVETQTPEERLLREIFTKPAAPARTLGRARDARREGGA